MYIVVIIEVCARPTTTAAVYIDFTCGFSIISKEKRKLKEHGCECWVTREQAIFKRE